MSFVGIIAGATAVYGGISANQARQDAKGSQGLTNQAVGTANQNYDQRAGLRAQGTAQVLSPQTYNLSSLYQLKPSALDTQAQAAQAQTLASLTNTPSVDQQVTQALSNYDAAALPQLAAERRQTGQSASTLGRIGSGGVTTTLGNLSSDYEKNRNITESNAITAAINQAQANKYATATAEGNIAGQQENLAQQGVQNNAAMFGQEQGAQAQNFGQGLSIANLGYSNMPTSTDLSGAANYNAQSNANAQGAANAFNQFGQSIASLTKPKTGAGFGTPTDPSFGTPSGLRTS